MAAKLIDLSFTLNGRKVKVKIAPDTMLFALLQDSLWNFLVFVLSTYVCTFASAAVVDFEASATIESS